MSTDRFLCFFCSGEALPLPHGRRQSPSLQPVKTLSAKVRQVHRRQETEVFEKLPAQENQEDPLAVSQRMQKQVA